MKCEQSWSCDTGDLVVVCKLFSWVSSEVSSRVSGVVFCEFSRHCSYASSEEVSWVFFGVSCEVLVSCRFSCLERSLSEQISCEVSGKVSSFGIQGSDSQWKMSSSGRVSWVISCTDSSSEEALTCEVQGLVSCSGWWSPGWGLRCELGWNFAPSLSPSARPREGASLSRSGEGRYPSSGIYGCVIKTDNMYGWYYT